MCFRPTVAVKKTVKCPKCGEANPLPLSIDTPMKDILENDASKTIFEKHCKEVLADPRFKKALGMTLKQIKPLSAGKVTQDMILAVAEELSQLPKPKCKSCGEVIVQEKGAAGPSGPAGPAGPKKG
jgi:hypothetical protein